MITRRDVLLGSVALAGLALLPSAAEASSRIRKPKRLGPGSRIALPAPASDGDYADEIVKCRKFIEAQGWVPVETANASHQWGLFAGTDQERADDINRAFADPAIDGIICIRGGYGSMRILPLLDEKVIRANPKVIMGFSDITALLVGINRRTGLTTFHGPNSLSSQLPYSNEWLAKAVVTGQPIGKMTNPDPLPGPEYQLTTLAGGKAKGRLVGGNLTLLSVLMGTKWAPKLDGSILFIEDVGEAPYRLDRMLSQLILSGDLKGCRGVACGQFTDCDSKDPASTWKVMDVLRDRLSGLGIPVVAGWAIGHVRPKLTLPIGCMAELDGDAMTLEVLEAAVD